MTGALACHYCIAVHARGPVVGMAVEYRRSGNVWMRPVCEYHRPACVEPTYPGDRTEFIPVEELDL